MRVSDAAEQLHCSASTVRNYCNNGLLHYTRTPYGHRNITQEDINRFLGKPTKETIRFYTRSSSGDQTLLKQQTDELTQAYGTPQRVYTDRASGLNEKRRGLTQLINDAERGEYNTLCITYRDRLTRFGYTYLEQLLNQHGVKIRVLHDNIKYSTEDELMRDFMNLIASFAGRFYRLRGRAQQKQLLHDAEELLS